VIRGGGGSGVRAYIGESAGFTGWLNSQSNLRAPGGRWILGASAEKSLVPKLPQSFLVAGRHLTEEGGLDLNETASKSQLARHW
jgi:hypothetical protein